MKKILAVLTLAATTASLLATTYNVPADGDLATVLPTARNGDIVIVATDSYTVSATLYVTNGVTLRSATGNFGDVSISGGNAVSRIVRVSGEGSRLEGITVRDLTATACCGSGIYAESGATVANCRVTAGNATKSNGDNILSGLKRYIGGYAIFNDNANLSAVTVDGLSSSSWIFGAVYQRGSDAFADRLTITNVTSSSGWNYGSTYLSCVGLVLTAGEVRNAFIADNKLTKAPKRAYSNGIFAHLSGGRLVNSAILDNVSAAADSSDAASEYSVPVLTTSSSASIVNSLIAGNLMGTVELNFRSTGGTAANCSYCCTTTTDTLPDANNVAIDETGYTRVAGGYYTLNAASVCVDAGSDESWMADATDINGATRIQGTCVDIGAVEVERASFDCSFTATAYSALERLETTLTASVVGDTTGAVYSWDLDGDGSYETTGSDKATVSLTLTTYGTTTVSLQVENGSGASATAQQDFTVLPSTIYFNSNGSTPVSPYATLATAATNITNAFAVALSGAEVLVATGVHAVAECIEPPSGVTVRGITGNRDDVVFSGNGAARLFKLVGAGTTLADVTLKNLPETTDISGNGVYAEDGTCITNCRFTASSFTSHSSSTKSISGYAVYSHNALVVDCLFDGISSTRNAYGLALYQYGDSALTDRCTLTNLYTTWWINGPTYPSCLGIAADGGEVRNTLVRDNRIAVTDGATKGYDLGALIQAVNATAANCTVIANELSPERGATTNCTFAVYSSGTGAFVNCLVSDNAIGDEVRNWKSTGANLSYCCTTDAASLTGDGNVEAAGSVWKTRANGRLALPSGSPCRNAGQKLAWMTGARDLYGETRVNGRLPDIGAVESAGDKLVIFLH